MHTFTRYWRQILSGWIAFVFIQSLFFKFSGSHETQHIFGTLGDWLGIPLFGEYGGYVIGIIELIASILLFTRWWAWGALLAFEIISAAVLFHLFTPLGIVMPAFDEAGNQVGNDGGTLFIMACITMVCSMIIVVKDWTSESSQIRGVVNKLTGK